MPEWFWMIVGLALFVWGYFLGWSVGWRDGQNAQRWGGWYA